MSLAQANTWHVIERWRGNKEEEEKKKKETAELLSCPPSAEYNPACGVPLPAYSLMYEKNIFWPRAWAYEVYKITEVLVIIL